MPSFQLKLKTGSSGSCRWNNKDFASMAALWELSTLEQVKMKELQGRLGDIDHWKNDPYEVVRFFRHCKGSLAETENRFRRMIQSRLKSGIDSLWGRQVNLNALRCKLPSVILKEVDKDGDPILLESIGDIKVYEQLYESLGPDEMMNSMLYLRETQLTRHPTHSNWQSDYFEHKYGRRVKQVTILLDLHNFEMECTPANSSTQAGLLDTIQCLAQIIGETYVGMVKRIIVLRALSPIYELGSLFATSGASAGIPMVMTSPQDYLEVLDQYLDRKALPLTLCSESSRPIALSGVSLNPGPLGNVCLRTICQKKNLFRRRLINKSNV